MPQFEDIASEETNQAGDNLICLEEEVLPNAEENSEIEHLSSNEGAGLEEEKWQKLKKKVSMKEVFQQRLLKIRVKEKEEWNKTLCCQSKYKHQLSLDRRQCLEKRFCTQ